MRRSASKLGRRSGFTLVEVALAAVVGTMLLMSLIYTARELSRAIAGVYNESILQTVFRDLEADVDGNIFVGLDGATDNNAYTGHSSPFTFASNMLTIANQAGAGSNFKLRFTPGTAASGGKLEYSTDNGATWRPMMSLGSRDLLANAAFNYSVFSTGLAVPSGAAAFTYDSRVDKNLLKIDAVLRKTDMVPFLMQSAYAPRATSWKWTTYSKTGITPPPGDQGGNFYPMALKRSQIDFTAPFNIFTGAGSGHFGWLTWDGGQSQTTLADSLVDPNSHQYVNPDDPDDRALSLNDWVNGKVGVVNSNAVRDALADLVGKEIDVIAWDNNVGQGSNTYIQAAGFARVKITAFDLPSKTITAEFVGWVDEKGELLPPSIISFFPTSGAVGRTVTVSGLNFDADPAGNDVRINGTPATVTAAAPNALTISVPAGASSGYITVETHDLSASSTQAFQVLPAPVITGFSPGSGGPGTAVTITGQNFDTTPSANVVLFNGIQATVMSGTATQLVVSVPVGATTGPISVTCNDNQLTLSSSAFTVPPPPTITGFTPATATIGQTVTIAGTNFDPVASGDTVRFNGALATVVSATATQIVVTVPAGATTGVLSVSANGQTNNAGTNFTVRPAPTITGFTPAAGGAGTSVTINGANFDPTPTENTVTINGTPATVTAANATKLVVTVAAGTTTGPIAVKIGTQSITSPGNFTYMADPVISGFSPASDYATRPVTITGANFDPTAGNNVVKFWNNVTATVVSATNTQIIAQVPAGAIDGPITVTVWGKTAQSVGSFNVTTAPAPAISSFSPATAYSGQNVTITGTNFSGNAADNSVRFNGALATVVTAAPNQLVVTVPPNATTGPLQVTVASLTGNSTTNFVFIPPPSIIDFTPAATCVNEQVTINGSGFDSTPGNNVVRFNGTSATVVSAGANQLTVNVPPGATTGPISVQTGGQTVTSGTNFTVTTLPAPVITGFNPAGTYAGQTVTITGRNFNTTASSNTVKFNGVAAVVSSSNGSTMTVTLPAGASTGKITVTNNGLTATSSTSFVVTAAPMPTIASFSPGSGIAGATVTITGTNFATPAANNTVKFNGVAAVVSGGNSGSLTVTVPAGATTGPISVTAAGNTATSDTSFIVIPPSTNVLPIAINQDVITGRSGNTSTGVLNCGFGSGQFCWLAWTADVSEAAWRTSLTPSSPNSGTYVNPLSGTDRHIDTGDWINAISGSVSNSSANKGQVDAALNATMIVPTFSSSTNSTPPRVQVSGFALVKITARSNSFNPNTLTFTFIRTCDSNGN